MNAIVIIPSPLRNLTNGERKVNIEVDNNMPSIENIILALNNLYPGILGKIWMSKINYINM